MRPTFQRLRATQKKLASPGDLFCSFPPLSSATVCLQFRPPHEALSSIKCTTFSMSRHPLFKVPVSSPGPGRSYTKQSRLSLATGLQGSQHRLEGLFQHQAAARHPDKHLKYQDSNPRHYFATHEGPAQDTIRCLGALKTLEISLKTDNMYENFRAAQDI